MMQEKDNRDILNVAAETGSDAPQKYPAENMPTETASRPTVSPQEGGYFLNKFLDQKADDTSSAENDSTTESENDSVKGMPPANKEELQENIITALQEIFDPEIPVNIYDMGLIYGVDVADDYSVKVTMTLTTPHCPVAESMPGEVELKVASVSGVTSAEVSLVWEPAWDMEKMSDEARLELGLL